MNRILVFISHSSSDKGIAMELAEHLRDNGLDVWIDHEQIRAGDSILRGIENGLKTCDAIFLLISARSVESPWCRAEYEPLLMNEIENGPTTVIPVRLDDTDVPLLLRPKDYIDLRSGITAETIGRLLDAAKGGRSETRIARLHKSVGASSEGSTLRMLISGILGTFAFNRITDADVLEGRSLLELYYAIDKLILQYQELCDELLGVLVESRVNRKHYGGSAYRLSQVRLVAANRKLTRIASDMREIASSFENIVKRNSPILNEINEIVQVCAAISIAEDFLVIRFGAPAEVHEQLAIERGKSRPALVSLPGQVADLHENYGAQGDENMVKDLQEVLSDLDKYRYKLRKKIANLSKDGEKFSWEKIL
jgi:hypothetical protein